MKSRHIQTGISLLILLFILMLAYNFFLKPRSAAEEDYSSIDTLLPDKEFLKQIPESLVFVQGGRYKMGGMGRETEYDEFPIHPVILNNFLMGKQEVTFEEYDQFCEENSLPKVRDAGWGRGKHPVINVSWFDAIRYCNWFSKKEGLESVYIMGEGYGGTNFQANGYRLPTEAEWEYAASEGKLGKKQLYSGSKLMAEVGWYDINSGNTTKEVAQLKPNKLGIYDMSGNVREWCHDWYKVDYYKESSLINPKGSDLYNSRIMRGGSWMDKESDCRLTNRDYMDPKVGTIVAGFRILRRL
ncbi:MAG: SUMF1/EgtB/PvdO family nonheme iron enzyme [Bacteroidia bacterium]|nr:SUMF1/EgtB/PvdO family nonheme iron enzyme [Bacteroidia bacterium]